MKMLVGVTAVIHTAKARDMREKNSQISIDGLPTGLLSPNASTE
jgi:hypothetical protein